MRVLTIGGGVSGILMAYHIQKECPNVEHVIYEKNADIGGTWYGMFKVSTLGNLADACSSSSRLENRYGALDPLRVDRI